MASASGSTLGKCPICARPSMQDYRPFCSRRCADVDLGRWLSGTYVIPDREEGADGTPSSANGKNGGEGSETGSAPSRTG